MRSKPRLLVVTPDFPPATGGIQHLLEAITTRLTGWDIEVLTRVLPESGEEVASPSHVAVRRGRLDGRPGVVEVNGLAAFTAPRRRPDVVLCGHVIAGVGAVAASRISRAPLVTYVYADEVPHRQRLARVSLSRSSRVVAISRYAADLAVAAGASPSRIRLIPPGADEPRTPSVSDPDELSIVTVARLTDRYKGHDLMLQALDLVRKDCPGVTWHVVGDGPLRADLEGRAHSLDLDRNVVFHGQVTDAQRDSIVAAASVFAMPSRLPPRGAGGEGFGIVYLEAALLGVPAVAGASAGVPDAVLDNVTGLLVDPEDPAAIADGLRRLLLDPVLRSRLGRQARVRAARDFNWDAITDRVDDVLRESLNAGAIDQS